MYLLSFITNIDNFKINNINISNAYLIDEISYWLINFNCRNLRHYRFSD